MIVVLFHQRMILTWTALWWPELGYQLLLLFLPFGRPLAWQFTIIMVFLYFLYLDFRFDHMKWPKDFLLIVGSQVWGHFLLFQSQNFEYQNRWPRHILVDSLTGCPALRRVSSNFTDEFEIPVSMLQVLPLACLRLLSRFGWALSVPIVILHDPAMNVDLSFWLLGRFDLLLLHPPWINRYLFVPKHWKCSAVCFWP